MLALKKFLIGLAIFGTFIVYSLGIRHQSPTLGNPTSLAATSTTASPTATTPVATASGSSPTTGLYKDGTYTGSVADAYYGNVQVSAIVSGGKITAVNFLQHPNSRSTSVAINQQAMPYLQQEAIQAQSSNVQVVSGATYTSQAFMQSLTSIISQAKV
jgi:uncharacterized protein with FMN-binding domain